jgi:amino acid adenylation domain-containing protein
VAVREVASKRLTRLLELAGEAEAGQPALVDSTGALTYAELEARSNCVAHVLRELGVARGDRVGLYMEKSLDAVAGLYGVLKAGAAYVPLDPLSPAHRIAQLVRDCEPRVLLADAETRAQWPAVAQSAASLQAILVLNRSAAQDGSQPAAPGCDLLWSDALDAHSGEGPPRHVPRGDDLAYILYTSGSTGVPKGVALTHANALAFVEWSAREFTLTSEDRLSSHAPLHFDLSIFDLFAGARAGAATVLVSRQTTIFPTQLVDLIEREEITVWYSVPSALIMMLHRGGLRPGRLSSLRSVLFAGEVFPPKHLRDLMTLLPAARFANLYGPTETNVCAWHEVSTPPAAAAKPVPIGKAIDGVELFAITDQGNIAGVGEVGELYVQGPTVMQGYWRDSRRTERSLVRHPCARRLQEPAYRTGDFVWRDEAGHYHLVGRRDMQVKTRGYRVELGEVEAVLHAHPAVHECAVVALADDAVTNRLAAVVVASDEASAEGLASFCAQRIPRHMVPERFELRDTLPKTTTGKVNRQLLAAQLLADQTAQRRTRRR